jgi:hypothetical protein
LRCLTCAHVCRDQPRYRISFYHGNLASRDGGDNIGDRLVRIINPIELSKLEFAWLLATGRKPVVNTEPDRADVAL